MEFKCGSYQHLLNYIINSRCSSLSNLPVSLALMISLVWSLALDRVLFLKVHKMAQFFHLIVILCVASYLPSSTGIVFRVKSSNNIARLQKAPQETPSIITTSSTTTTTPQPPRPAPTPPPPQPPKPVMTRRKYINDDYFSSADDSNFVDPWRTLNPARSPAAATNNLVQQNPLLQILLAQNVENSHKFLAPFGKPRVFMPLYWGLSGYGLYSYSAGNDLHNNQPTGSYKYVREHWIKTRKHIFGFPNMTVSALG